MYKPKLDKDIRCPLEYDLEIFREKSKSHIISVLAGKGILRYSELRKETTNIIDTVLSASLKNLILDKIVISQSFDEIPQR